MSGGKGVGELITDPIVGVRVIVEENHKEFDLIAQIRRLGQVHRQSRADVAGAMHHGNAV